MSEPASYVFRTAVGGFHKGDVSAYIAKTAAEHQAQIADLEARNTALEEQLVALRLENDSLRQQQTPETAAPQKEPETIEKTASLQSKELTAYRRAEAAERLACQRAKKLYQDMQDICTRSAQQLELTDSTAQSALETIQAQLDVIHTSISNLYDAVRGASDKLREMGQMVPDPAEGLEEY